MRSRGKISNNYRRFVINRIREDGIFKIDEKYITWYKNKFLFDFYYNRFGTSHIDDFKSVEEIAYERKLKYNAIIANEEFIYVFGNYNSGVCKIGYSTNPLKRLSSIQTSFPFKLEILVVIKGNREIEKRLHRKYKKFKTNGEWFYLKDELKLAIEKLALTDKNIAVKFLKL